MRQQINHLLPQASYPLLPDKNKTRITNQVCQKSGSASAAPFYCVLFRMAHRQRKLTRTTTGLKVESHKGL